MVFLDFVIAVVLAGILTWGLDWIALIPWRRTAAQHWTERARKLYPILVGTKLMIFYLPAMSILVGCILRIGDSLSLGALGVGGWLGALAGTYPIDREIRPRIRLRSWLHQIVPRWLLGFGIWLPLVAAAAAMPAHFGWPMLVIALGAAGFILCLNFGLNLWLMGKCRLLLPPSGRLQGIVSETSRAMDVPVHRVWILRTFLCYAAAFVTTKDLVFSERLVELLSDEEIAAVCAHELAHLNEPRSVLVRRIIATFTLYPLIFVKLLTGSSDSSMFAALLCFAAWAVVMIKLARRLSRKMEVRADQTATEKTANPAVYARALERLYEDNQMPAVMRSNRLMHPHLYDRMLAAGVTPDYPRPKRPRFWAWNGLLATIVWVVIMVWQLSVATQ
jgi:Zn-dependent protease with chaperone function